MTLPNVLAKAFKKVSKMKFIPAQTAQKQEIENEALKQVLTVSEAAELLRVSPTTLRRLESEGKISSFRKDNGYRTFNRTDVLKLKKLLETKVSPVSRTPSAQTLNSIPEKSKPINIHKFALVQIMVVSAVATGLAIIIGTGGVKAYQAVLSAFRNDKVANKTEVLAAADRSTQWVFKLNMPALFRQLVTIGNDLNVQGNLTVEQLATLAGGIETNNQNANLGTGSLTAGVVNFIGAGTLNNLLAIDTVTKTTLQNALELQGDIESTGLGETKVVALNGETLGDTMTNEGNVLMALGGEWVSTPQTNITELGTITTGVWNGSVIQPSFGGTGITGYSIGDLIYASGTSTLATLPISTAAGYILTSTGTAPSWQSPTSLVGNFFWLRAGNTGTTPDTDYLGSTDNVGLSLRTNATERLRITETGRIGIATTNPRTTLHVGDGSVTPNYVNNANESTFIEGNLEVAGTIYGTLVGAITPTDFDQYGVFFADATGTLSNDDSKITFNPGTNVLDVNGAGDFSGLLTLQNGLTISGGTLNVQGTITLGDGGDTIALSGTSVTFDDTNLSSPLMLTQSDTAFTSGDTAIIDAINSAYEAAVGTGDGIWLITSGTIRPNQVSQNLAIGGSDPSASLFYNTTNQQLALTNTTSNNTLVINDTTSDATPLIVDANGNLGIGTTSATSILSVGQTNQFTVNSSGAITAATGITSSGTVTFSGLNANEFVRTTTGGTLTTTPFIDLNTHVTGMLPLTNGGLGFDPTTAPTGNILIANGTGLVSRNINGDASLTAAGLFTLTNTGVTAGTYGATTDVPIITVDSKGRITGINTAPISFALDGTGTTNFLTKWADSNSLTTGSIYDNGSQIGVGTQAPLATFDVRGALRLGTNSIQGNQLNTTPSSSAPSGSLYWGSRTLLDDTNSGSYIASLLTSANAGITLSGSTGPITLTLDTTTTGTTSVTASNSGLEISADGVRLIGGCSGSQILSWDAGASRWRCASIAGAGGIIGSGSLNQVAFWDGTSTVTGTDDFWWNAGTAKLGLGTTAPTSRLTITSSDAAALQINPFGTSSGNTGDFRLLELVTNGINYTGFKSPDNLDQNIVYTLPNSTAPTDYVLTYQNGNILQWKEITGVGGAGDITSVGSITSGSAFSDTTADNQWLGLGASAGRIEFDDQATDEVNILSAFVGINNAAPTVALDVTGQLAVSSTASLNGSLVLSNTPTGTTDSVLVLGATNQVGSRTIDSRVWGTSLIDAASTHPALQLNAGSTTYLSLNTGSQVLTANAIDLSNTSNTNGLLPTSRGGLGIDSSTAPAGTLIIATGSGFNIKSMGGDATIDSTGTLTLANTGVTAATYGSTTGIPVLTIDSKGRITSATTAPVFHIFDGSGIANYLARWSDADTLTTGVVYDNGTNVGIGTTNPTTKLHIQGSGGALQALYNSGNNLDAFNTFALTDENAYWFFGLDDHDNKFGIGYATAALAGNMPDTNRFLSILTNGNVGIGLTAPGAKFHVAGDVYSAAEAGYTFNNGSSLNDIYTQGNLEIDGTLYVTTAAINQLNIGGDTIADFAATSTGLGITGTTLSIDTVTAGITLTTASNSGLEIATDGVRLLGGCAANQVLAWDAGANRWKCSSTATGTVTGTGVATRLAFWDSTSNIASSQSLYWDNANLRLGIGTSSPTSMLDVGGNIMVGRYIGATTAASTIAGSVMASGRLGIGTSQPGYKLDIVSDSLFEGGNHNFIRVRNQSAMNVNLFDINNNGLLYTSNNTVSSTNFSSVVNFGNNSSASGNQQTAFFMIRPNSSNVGPVLRVLEGTSDYFMIDNGGLVGIGTTAMLGQLDVRGGIRLGVNAAQGNTLNTLPSSSAPTSSLYWGSRTLLDDVNLGNYGVLNLASANGGLTLSGATGPVTITLDAITSGTSSTTASNSGLEIASDGLRLLGGCSNGQILSWNSGATRWECTTNSGGLSGSGVATRIAFWNGTSSLASSQDLYWDNTNIRLGIGTSTPTAKLSIAGNGISTIANSSGDIAIMPASGKVGIGTSTPGNNLEVVGNLAVGSAAFLAARTAPSMGLLVEGNVGIGVTAASGWPQSKLAVAGLGSSAGVPIVADGSGNFYRQSSSIRFKENIENLDTDFYKILDLNPVSYNYKDTGVYSVGYIAEEVQKLGKLPGFVITNENGQAEGLRYDLLGFYLKEIVKDQQLKIEDLTGEMSQMKSMQATAAGNDNTALQKDVQELDQQFTNASVKINDIDVRISYFEELLGLSETTESSQTPPLLTQINDLYLQLNDMIAALGITKQDDALLVSADLNVLGDTTLNNITITGNLMAGQIKLDTLQNAIQIIGPACYTETGDLLDTNLCDAQALYLQKNLAGNVDIFDGKVLIEPNGDMTITGNLKAKKVSADEYELSDHSDLVGSGTLSAGETSVTIETSSVKENSKIFITPTTYTGQKPLIVKSKNAGQSFEVAIESTYDEDIKFDWWILNVAPANDE